MMMPPESMYMSIEKFGTRSNYLHGRVVGYNDVYLSKLPRKKYDTYQLFESKQSSIFAPISDDKSDTFL